MLESCSFGSRESCGSSCGLEKFKDNDSGGIPMIYVAFLSPSSAAAAHAHIMTGFGLAWLESFAKNSKFARVSQTSVPRILHSSLHYTTQTSFHFLSLVWIFSSFPQASQQQLQTAAALRQEILHKIFFLFSLAF